MEFLTLAYASKMRVSCCISSPGDIRAGSEAGISMLFSADMTVGAGGLIVDGGEGGKRRRDKAFCPV